MMTKDKKSALKTAIETKAKSLRAFSLRDTAEEIGVTHVTTGECIEISRWFCDSHPEYKAVRMTDAPKGGNLFSELYFVEKALEFEEV